MKKNFLLLLLMTLLMPLGAWAQGNIGVQLSTTMTKEFGAADPVYLDITDFVIISNTTGEEIDETDLAGALEFKRKQGQEGEGRGTYDYEVTVSAAFSAEHPTWNVVATNTGRITITAKPLNAEMIGEIEDDPFTFKAAAWEPKPTVTNGETALDENTDFTYDWADNINAGTGKIIIEAVEGGNYSGTAEKTFTINQREVSAENLLITYEDEFTYQGVEIKPVVTVKDQTLGDLGTLVLGSDYVVNYYENINATPNETTARLKVKMPAEGGNYSFTAANKYFTINKQALTISIPEAQRKVYGEEDPALEVKYVGFVNGETAEDLAELDPAQFVVPAVTRVAGENAGVYAISITNAAAVVEGARNYEVTISDAPVNFSIQAKDIADVNITLSDKEGDDYTYNGEEHSKNVSVAFGENPALTENVDYTVATTNNINAGTGENGALVTVTGINNYKGTKTANFDIAKANISVIPNVASKAYGVAQDPALTYTLKVGETTVDNNVLNGTVELQREEGETVGAYKIWFKKYTAGTTADNYTIVNTDVKADEVAAERYALFTITGSEETLYLKFKEGTTATKVYGEEDPVWSVDDLEVDTEKGGAACDDWDAIKYSFGDPIFTYTEEEGVADAGEYEVTVTGLESPIYPNVEVAPLAFEITARPIAVAVDGQNIAYGTALEQGMYQIVDGYTIIGEDQPVVLETVNPIGTYAPGSVTEDAIIAKITEGNTNYVLDEEDCTWGTLTVDEAGELTDFYLWDGDENVLEKITAYNGLPVHALIKIDQRDRELGGKARTWAAEKWNTMTLPFDITVAELSQILGYAVVNVVDADGYSEESGAPVYKFNLTMKGGYGEDFLPANKPFTIKTTDALNAWIEEHADEDGYLDFGNRTIVAPTDDDFAGVAAGGGSTFKPAYAKREVTSEDEGNIWFLLGNYTKWAYIKSTSTATWDIVPFEGFIDQTNNTAEAESAIFLMEEEDGTTTAIRGINVDDANNDSLINAKGWYNLNGVKMETAPAMKGVYIKDGKKVVIK